MDLSLLQYTSQQRYKCKYKYIKRRFKTNINNICKNRRNYGDSLWRISKTYLKYVKFYEAGTPRLQSWEVQKEQIGKILEEAGFDINIRGERLTIKDFANLTKVIEKNL